MGNGDEMSVAASETSGFSVPEHMSWDELQQLPDEVAGEIELWDRKVVWNRRGPLVHQRFSVRMRNAIESEARRAMRDSTDSGEQRCWEVEVETNVFFKADKASFLTPDFMVRRCLPRDADTSASDVVLVGEVLSASDTHARLEWKKARYAGAGIPYYWEVELDSGASWDIRVVRAYELALVQTTGLAIKPLRPAVYVPVGEWEPRDIGIDIAEPFDIHILWEDLAF